MPSSRWTAACPVCRAVGQLKRGLVWPLRTPHGDGAAETELREETLLEKGPAPSGLADAASLQESQRTEARWLRLLFGLLPLLLTALALGRRALLSSHDGYAATQTVSSGGKTDSREDRHGVSTCDGDCRCDGDFHSLKAGSTCVTTFSKAIKGDHRLRATEPSVGYANVARQVHKHFGSKKKAEKWFHKHTIPAVIGDADLYVTDSHHHLLALAQDTNLWDLDMTIELVADFRGLGEDFWPQMRKQHYCLLLRHDPTDPLAFPVEVGPDALPLDWDVKSFSDNLWRSLAAFAGHYKPEKERCYIKTCDFFIDYQWAYVFQVATTQKKSLWPKASAAQSLYEKLVALPRAPSIDSIDLSTWKDLGADMLPLCHSPSLEDYLLPPIFGIPTLRGWSVAEGMPEDPECERRLRDR